jgi:urease accessory protein
VADAISALLACGPPRNFRAMHLVYGSVTAGNARRVEIPVDRLTLAKRRWRGVATDGAEFAFDLEEALVDGETVLATENATYCIAQQPESVIEVALEGSAASAARLAWMFGNLHFPIAIEPDHLLVADDPAARLVLERAGTPYRLTERVFCPMKSAPHNHGH